MDFLQFMKIVLFLFRKIIDAMGKLQDILLNREFKEVALTNTFIREVLPAIETYERRLFLLLVNEVQSYMKGQKLDDSFDVNKWSSSSFSFFIRDLLNDDDQNYKYAREAIQKLMKKRFPFEFGDKRKLVGEVNFLNGYIYEEKIGRITISLDEIVWQAIFNFASGFQYVDLYVCLMCNKEYSIYFYSLIYDQDEITIGIDTLRERLKLTSKYKNAGDIIKKVVVPAMEDLNKYSPRSFTFEIEKDKKRGAPIKNIKLHAKFIPENLPKRQFYRSRPTMAFSFDVMELLKNKFGFDTKGLSANAELFNRAEEKMNPHGLFEFLTNLAPHALRANNTQGYVVNAVKKQLGESCDDSKSKNSAGAGTHSIGALFGTILNNQ